MAKLKCNIKKRSNNPQEAGRGIKKERKTRKKKTEKMIELKPNILKLHKMEMSNKTNQTDIA